MPEPVDDHALRASIRAAGLRATGARVAVLRALASASGPVSHADVCAIIGSADFDRATVYRNLKLLVEAGEIQQVTLPGDSARYEPARQAHHHHFQCTRCQRVFDVHHCPGDMAQLAPAGFLVSEDVAGCVDERIGNGACALRLIKEFP